MNRTLSTIITEETTMKDTKIDNALKNNERYQRELMYLSEEDFAKIQIRCDDSKESCIYKLLAFMREFSADSSIPYNYVTSIFDDIPKKYRLEVLLGVFAKYFFKEYDVILELFDRHMKEESEEEKAERISNNKTRLSRIIKKDGTISCYRKVSMGDITPVWSFGFNTNLKKVQNSIYYSEGNVRIPIAGFNVRYIHIEDILFCGSNNEVYVIPEAYEVNGELPDCYAGSYGGCELYLDNIEFEIQAGGFYDELELN